MTNLKKHFGSIRNTGTRCVVVFMQIPDAPDHALVVETERLPPRFETALLDIAESPEGQGTHKLYDVLNRRLDPSTGKNMLMSLHEANLLKRVHIDQIVMQPTPNYPFPLRKVLEGMVEQGTAVAVPNPGAPTMRQSIGEPMSMEETYKHNQFAANARADADGNRQAIARNLILEGQLLEQEANRKYEQAYHYAPDMRPADHRAKSIGMASSDAMQPPSSYALPDNPGLPDNPVLLESEPEGVAADPAPKTRGRKKTAEQG